MIVRVISPAARAAHIRDLREGGGSSFGAYNGVRREPLLDECNAIQTPPGVYSNVAEQDADMRVMVHVYGSDLWQNPEPPCAMCRGVHASGCGYCRDYDEACD